MYQIVPACILAGWCGLWAWQLPAPASRSKNGLNQPSLKQDDSLGIHSIFQLAGISIQGLSVKVTVFMMCNWKSKNYWVRAEQLGRISHFPTGILTPQLPQQAKSCPLPWLWSRGQYNHNPILQPCILLPLAQSQVLGIGSLFWKHSHVAWKKSSRFSKCCLSPSGRGYCSLGDCGCSFHSFPPQRRLCWKQKSTVRLCPFPTDNYIKEGR